MLVAASVLSACATYGPPGPSVPVYAGDGKTPMQFQSDDVNCRQRATAFAGDPAQAEQSQAGSAIIGTLLGAALGAAIGGGRGAGIGAASGALLGTGAGSGQASGDASRIQRRWDVEYRQCMYNFGHKVPGFATMQQPASAPAMPPPPPVFQPGAAVPPATVTPGSCKSGRYARTPQGTYVEVCN